MKTATLPTGYDWKLEVDSGDVRCFTAAQGARWHVATVENGEVNVSWDCEALLTGALVGLAELYAGAGSRRNRRRLAADFYAWLGGTGERRRAPSLHDVALAEAGRLGWRIVK